MTKRQLIDLLKTLLTALAAQETPTPTPLAPPTGKAPPTGWQAGPGDSWSISEAELAAQFIPHGFEFDASDGGYWQRGAPRWDPAISPQERRHIAERLHPRT